jgi:choline dehydrogenase
MSNMSADHVAKVIAFLRNERKPEDVSLEDVMQLAELMAEGFQQFFKSMDLSVYSELGAMAREIANTKAFAGLNGGEIVPGPDADLEAFIRAQSSTLWHPAGTCTIGYDARAVVDPSLRVYGVQGLRVADASVMPTLNSANTNAPVVMIAERCAQFVLGQPG